MEREYEVEAFRRERTLKVIWDGRARETVFPVKMMLKRKESLYKCVWSERLWSWTREY